MADTKHTVVDNVTKGKATPGPWVAIGEWIVPLSHKDRPFGWSIYKEQNKDKYAQHIATVASDDEYGRGTQQANTALIEAAPEQQAKIDRLEHEKSVLVKANDQANRAVISLRAEKAELVGVCKKLLNQFEKWEGYHQWDEEDEVALEDAQAILAKAEPQEIRNPKSDNQKPQAGK